MQWEIFKPGCFIPNPDAEYLVQTNEFGGSTFLVKHYERPAKGEIAFVTKWNGGLIWYPEVTHIMEVSPPAAETEY